MSLEALWKLLGEATLPYLSGAGLCSGRSGILARGEGKGAEERC